MENYSFENIRVLVGDPNREVRDGIRGGLVPSWNPPSPWVCRFKSTIAPAVLAVFLGLAAAPPVAWAFAEQTDSWTYDIDKEDAELGDYSGWNSRADRKDARFGYDFGRNFGYGRPAGSGQDDGQTPANSGRSGPIPPVGSSQPKDHNTFNDRQGTTPRTK